MQLLDSDSEKLALLQYKLLNTQLGRRMKYSKKLQIKKQKSANVNVPRVNANGD